MIVHMRTLKRAVLFLLGVGAAVFVVSFVTACTTVRSDVTQVDWSDQPTVDGVDIQTVVDGLDHPWSVAWLPDRGFLITERSGRLLRFRDDATTPQEIVGVPDVFAEGQGGLLDITLHPRFEENRLVYLSYASGTREANRTRVSRYRLDGDRLVDGERIFQVNEDKNGRQHFGSRFLWLPDGTLLISIGDGGNPPLRFEGALQREQAQDTETLFGMVARVADDGSIPDDNPFLAADGVRPEFFTIGNRNIQGIARDDSTGAIWVTEHGSRGGDELNLVRAGLNYGWPLVSHSREYVRGTPVSRVQSLDGYEDPRLVWSDAIAPSGLAIRDGRLYAGGLRSQAVHEIVVVDGVYQSQRTIPIGARVRDVRIGPDGALYVLTDESESGRLLRITIPE